MSAYNWAYNEGNRMSTCALRHHLPGTLMLTALGLFVATVSFAEPDASQARQEIRWHEYICPTVSGLQGAADDLVSRRITAVARTVGAPTPAAGKKCDVNVEVVFTLSPQKLLDHIAKEYRPMLGYIPTSDRQPEFIFSRPVEAWYVTGTRTLDYQPPIDSQISGNDATSLVDMYTPGLHVDSYESADSASGMGPSGVAGSLLSKGQSREFMHALILVDSTAVAKYPLQGISDYIAMLALTRVAAPDSCGPRPSIINLFATGCTAVPTMLTTADIAWLKGLYGADLDKNLNIELGDMHREMQGR